jgi:uncharacterized membrane protein YphA (DoxX/SURF4 family)
MATKTIVLWILSGLLSLELLFAGSQKLRRVPAMVAAFSKYGLPRPFLLFIGAAEVAAAIGFLVPPLRWWAALGMVPIMLGAVFLHLRGRDSFGHTVPAVVTLLLVAAVLWGA